MVCTNHVKNFTLFSKNAQLLQLSAALVQTKATVITLLDDVMSEIDLKPLYTRKTNFYFIAVTFYPDFLGILPLPPYQKPVGLSKHRFGSE